MPNIPCDLDKNFGRQAQEPEDAAKHKTSPVLLAMSVLAFGYALLHIAGYV